MGDYIREGPGRIIRGKYISNYDGDDIIHHQRMSTGLLVCAVLTLWLAFCLLIPSEINIRGDYQCVNDALLDDVIRRAIGSNRQFLKNARTLIRNKGRDWNCTDTRLIINGPNIDISLTSGSRTHQYYIYLQENGAIALTYSRHYSGIRITDRRYTSITSSTVDNLINEVGRDVNGVDMQILKCFHELIRKEGQVWNATDVKVIIQGSGMYISVVSGAGIHLYYIYLDGDGMIYSNQSRSYPPIKIDRRYDSITSLLMFDILAEVSYDVTDLGRKVLEAARIAVLREGRKWIWDNALLEISCENMVIVLSSGSRTNKFAVFQSDKNTIIGEYTQAGWSLLPSAESALVTLAGVDINRVVSGLVGGVVTKLLSLTEQGNQDSEKQYLA